MKGAFRFFRVPYHDGYLYDLHCVELNADGKIIKWSADAMFTLENLNDAPVLADGIREAQKVGAVDMAQIEAIWDD